MDNPYFNFGEFLLEAIKWFTNFINNFTLTKLLIFFGPILLLWLLLKLYLEWRGSKIEKAQEAEVLLTQPTADVSDHPLQKTADLFLYHIIKNQASGYWEETGYGVRGIYLSKRTSNPNQINNTKGLALKLNGDWYEFINPITPIPANIELFKTQVGLQPRMVEVEGKAGDETKREEDESRVKTEQVPVTIDLDEAKTIDWGPYTLEIVSRYTAWFEVELGKDEKNNPHYYPHLPNNEKRVLLVLAKYKDEDIIVKPGEDPITHLLFEYAILEGWKKESLHVWDGAITPEEEVPTILGFLDQKAQKVRFEVEEMID